MTVLELKQQLREMIATLIEEEELLPIEFLTDGIPKASHKYRILLARYHVHKAAEIVMDIHWGPAFDPEWLTSSAIAGLKDLIRDVLAEKCSPGQLQRAYVLTRKGEEIIIPITRLTPTEFHNLNS